MSTNEARMLQSPVRVHTPPQQRRASAGGAGGGTTTKSSSSNSGSSSPVASPRAGRRKGSGLCVGDRFIPARNSAPLDLDLSHFKLLRREGAPATTGSGGRKENTLPSPSAHHNAATLPSSSTTATAAGAADTTPAKEEYRSLLERTLLGSEGRLATRVLSFSAASSASASPASDLHLGGSAAAGGNAPPTAAGPNSATGAASPLRGAASPHRILHVERERAAASSAAVASSPSSPLARRRAPRRLPSSAERVLDAPDLVDDYYLNLVDWSGQNVVAVALGPSVYLWNSGSGAITQLVSLGEDEGLVTSVSFSAGGGDLVAVGTQAGEVQLWDVGAARRVRRILGHSGRVGASSWNPTHAGLLSTGSRDALVLTHDSRAARPVIATHDMHSQEVCGVRWSPDGTQLATGGNDNLLCVWDASASWSSAGDADKPRHVMEQHTAAVKALAWCPWQANLLASGGGTADRCIRFWNTATGGCSNAIDTKSQVCALQWSKHSRELVSSHGFSQNQLIVWNYPSMSKVGELTGHTSRVLHLALSPDGTTAVSAAGDETLRFWRLFEPKAPTADRASSPCSVLRRLDIR